MEKKSAAVVRAVVERCEEAGINILDCWMAGPEVRSNLGAALAGTRDRWIIQGHIGSTWQDGQYVRTRDMDLVRPAFEDLLARLGTDHVELGMIHYVDDVDEYEGIMPGSSSNTCARSKPPASSGISGCPPTRPRWRREPRCPARSRPSCSA